MSKSNENGNLFASTQAELGSVFGVDARTVRRWLRDGAPPKSKAGFCVNDWISWVFDRRSGLDNGDGENLTQATRRLQVARADREELKRERELRGVIEMTEHVRILREQARWFVGVMDRAAPELVVELSELLTDRAKAREVVKEYFDGIRREAASR